MLIKLNRNLYYWKYWTKIKIRSDNYNVTDMTDKASNLVKNGKFRDVPIVSYLAYIQNWDFSYIQGFSGDFTSLYPIYNIYIVLTILKMFKKIHIYRFMDFNSLKIEVWYTAIFWHLYFSINIQNNRYHWCIRV